MSHPTCCCSVSLDRCDRCDLLVGLEGFHLMSVARTPDTLVLDIESCDRCAGCPGCGVIAQGHGHVVVEVIDAPWAGDPVRIRWHNTVLDMPRTRLRNGVIPGAQREGARPGRVWGYGRFAGRSDSCASKEPPSLAWPDNWQPRGTPCGPTSSRACKPHLMTPPVSQECRCWGLTRGVWHHQDRRRRGPHALTGIVDLTRGEEYPTARLSGSGPRKVWHRA